MTDADELAWAITAWASWAATTAQEHPEAARLALRTVEALRLEQQDGIARCTCCLKPYGPH